MLSGMEVQRRTPGRHNARSSSHGQRCSFHGQFGHAGRCASVRTIAQGLSGIRAAWPVANTLSISPSGRPERSTCRRRIRAFLHSCPPPRWLFWSFYPCLSPANRPCSIVADLPSTVHASSLGRLICSDLPELATHEGRAGSDTATCSVGKATRTAGSRSCARKRRQPATASGRTAACPALGRNDAERHPGRY